MSFPSISRGRMVIATILILVLIPVIHGGIVLNDVRRYQAMQSEVMPAHDPSMSQEELVQLQAEYLDRYSALDPPSRFENDHQMSVELLNRQKRVQAELEDLRKEDPAAAQALSTTLSAEDETLGREWKDAYSEAVAPWGWLVEIVYDLP